MPASFPNVAFVLAAWFVVSPEDALRLAVVSRNAAGAVPQVFAAVSREWRACAEVWLRGLTGSRCSWCRRRSVVLPYDTGMAVWHICPHCVYDGQCTYRGRPGTRAPAGHAVSLFRGVRRLEVFLRQLPWFLAGGGPLATGRFLGPD